MLQVIVFNCFYPKFFVCNESQRPNVKRTTVTRFVFTQVRGCVNPGRKQEMAQLKLVHQAFSFVDYIVIYLQLTKSLFQIKK